MSLPWASLPIELDVGQTLEVKLPDVGWAEVTVRRALGGDAYELQRNRTARMSRRGVISWRAGEVLTATVLTGVMRVNGVSVPWRRSASSAHELFARAYADMAEVSCVAARRRRCLIRFDSPARRVCRRTRRCPSRPRCPPRRTSATRWRRRWRAC